MSTLIVIKNSKVPGDSPTKLTPGELAINIADGNLYYGDTNNDAQLLSSGGGGGVTQITAGSNITVSPVGGTGNVTINATGGGGSTPPGGTNTQIQYNNAGTFGGVSNLTWDGTTLRATGSFTGSFTGNLIGTASFITGSNVYGPFGSNSILSASFAVSSSRAVSSSYALTASYALNSIPAFPYTGSARITGSLGVTGSFSTTADALINGLTIGRGGGNTSTNTALGYQALSSSVAGNNIAIGYQAGKYQTGDTSTIIGTYQAPDLTNFNANSTLNVGKQGLPHFWAPIMLMVDPASNDKILSIDSTQYSAAFIDYNLQDETEAMRAGTLKIIWKSDGTYKLTEESTDSIGYTFNYYFTVKISGGVFKVNLYNDDDSYNVKINYTCRLLIRPF
jgi:hypothetical protein